MTVITNTKTLAQRARQLRVLVDRLRHQYRQASMCVELNPPAGDVDRALYQQLKLLVPLNRVLAALEQQGTAPTDKAKALYLARHAAALALVDSMIPWANDESAYGGLLALSVPVRAEDFFALSAEVISLGDHLANQRELFYKKKRLSASLVVQLVQSLTPEQRALVAQYHQHSGGRVLEISNRQLEDTPYRIAPVVME